MNDYENAIELNSVTKRYDGFTLDSVSLTVPKGSIMGFIGQNGAGKTTTMRSLLNITKIDSGDFDDMFTPKDMAKIFSGLYPQWEDKTYSDYLERFELPYKKKIGKFSKGMKMKLQIACALSHNAKLLIMDEATSGLDPVVRDEILHIFMEYMQTGERTILMSSHITSDLEKIADCVTFIDKGSVLISGYKDEVLDNHGIIKCSNDDVKLIDPSDIVSVRTNSFGAEVMIHNRQSAAYRYKNMMIDPASLEDIMLYYVNKGRKEWS